MFWLRPNYHQCPLQFNIWTFIINFYQSLMITCNHKLVLFSHTQIVHTAFLLIVTPAIIIVPQLFDLGESILKIILHQWELNLLHPLIIYLKLHKHHHVFIKRFMVTLTGSWWRFYFISNKIFWWFLPGLILIYIVLY